MKTHYLDPSAWIKRHFHEAGSEAVNLLFQESIEAACCQLGMLEMLAATSRKSLSTPVAKAVFNSVVENIRADFAAFRVVAVDEPRIHAAVELALRHGLRAMDAVHLACALDLRGMGEVVMVSSDIELLEASRREGLVVINPATGSTQVPDDPRA